MDNTNILGLDKFQVTVIKSKYASMKPIITKRDKLAKKIEETTQKFKEKLDAALASIRQEEAAYNEQLDYDNQYAKDITQKTCGIALTTEQTIEFLENPGKFEEYKKSIGIGNGLFADEAPVEAAIPMEEKPQKEELWENA